MLFLFAVLATACTVYGFGLLQDCANRRDFGGDTGPLRDLTFGELD